MAALAGCVGGDGGGFDDPPGQRRGQRITDYERLTVRDRDADPVFWRAGDDDEEESAASHSPVGAHVYVASEEDLEGVAFADTEPASELAAFVRETDFDGESVLLESTVVRECYSLRLRGVWREDDGGLETSFCSALRPADAACSADAEDAVGVGIRLPFSLDDVGGFGSQWSSSCDSRPSPVTPAGDGGDGS